MTDSCEAEVRRILGGIVQPDNRLYRVGGYVSWLPGRTDITLDGEFSADELAAIAWWMKHKDRPTL